MNKEPKQEPSQQERGLDRISDNHRSLSRLRKKYEADLNERKSRIQKQLFSQSQPLSRPPLSGHRKDKAKVDEAQGAEQEKSTDSKGLPVEDDKSRNQRVAVRGA